MANDHYPEYVKDSVARIVSDVHELVDALELEIEDILSRFFDRVMEHKEKFGLEDIDE